MEQKRMRPAAVRTALCAFLAILLLFSALPIGCFTAGAATTRTQAEAVAWINSAVGKKFDWDNADGLQCVDLIRYYYAYLGADSPGGNASTYASNDFKLPSGWQRIQYKSGFVAQPGDIAVWLGPTANGHVALVVSATATEMNVVEQNHDAKADKPANRTTYRYNNNMRFYGVIRPLFNSTSTPSVSYTSVQPGIYWIRGKQSGRYLHVEDGKDNNTQNVSLYTRNDSSAFPMQISLVSNNQYKIHPLCSASRLVNPYSDTPGAGSKVNLYNDVSNNTQWWQFEASGGGYIIHNVYNLSCVLEALGTADLSDIRLGNRTGGDNQIWFLEPAAYSVSYDANGGDNAPASQSKTWGQTLTLSNQCPVRDGYEFLGWSASPTASTASYTPGSAYTANAAITLYAVWKEMTVNGTWRIGTPDIGGKKGEIVYVPLQFGEIDEDSEAVWSAIDIQDLVYDESTLRFEGYTQVTGSDYWYAYETNGERISYATPQRRSNQNQFAWNMAFTVLRELPEGTLAEGIAPVIAHATVTMADGTQRTALVNLEYGYVPEEAPPQGQEVGALGNVNCYDKQVGDTILVPVSLNEAPAGSRWGAFQATLQYDHTVLQLEDDWSNIPGKTDWSNIPEKTTAKANDETGRIAWASAEGVANGVIGYLRFTLLSVPADRSTAISGRVDLMTAMYPDRIEEMCTTDSVLRSGNLISIGLGEAAFQYRVSTESGTPYAIITGCNEALLGDVAIPPTLGGAPVRTIQSEAFAYCRGLTSLTIPATVETIEDRAFWSCYDLQAIHVVPENPNYCSENGTLLNKEGTHLLCCPPGRQGAYTVPESVIVVRDNSFDVCDQLTDVTFPASVKTIGMNNFFKCSRLQVFHVAPENPFYLSEDGVLLSKDRRRLIRCPAGREKAYTLPETVTSIGERAFSEGDFTLYIPLAVTEIDATAFGSLENGYTFNGTIYYAGTWAQWAAFGTDVSAVCQGEDSPGSTSDPRYGKITDDDKINAADALYILQYAVSKRSLTPEKLAAADVTGDGKVNAGDALYILQYAVGKRTSFPVQNQ